VNAPRLKTLANEAGAPWLTASIAAVAVELELAQIHRLSPDEYHRLLEAGGFDEDARVELLDGLLAAMSPKTRAHENAVAWLARWLITNVDPGAFQVRVASPLTLGNSEPEPDLAVIPVDAPRPYHPGTATLIVEVAMSSLERDLHIKRRLYAAAGVPEYWVLDLDRRRLVVHRNLANSDYTDVHELGAPAHATATAVALPTLAITDLLAAADA
jgi:Uma2 family endonuclease